MSGKRYSRQRELIYQTIKGTDQHPTAEMVYNRLKPDNPSLSLGTVYRNLNLLAEEGLIVRMPFPVDRYDANTKPHSHFLCCQCGCVYDLPVPYDEALDQAASSASGHQIQRHELLCYGICIHCQSLSEENLNERP
ncbi:MAG: transcriptional repressor [Oscillospiraceae bacterium]|nr:transcriptional repressor [Oscillospiraceae bacterium]